MGHQVQVLTSDHRLPPMGLPGSKGVFRELRLFTEPTANPLLGHSYGATLAHERYNAEILESRVRRFKPDAVYVWNMEGLSKSLLFRLQDKGPGGLRSALGLVAPCELQSRSLVSLVVCEFESTLRNIPHITQ